MAADIINLSDHREPHDMTASLELAREALQAEGLSVDDEITAALVLATWGTAWERMEAHMLLSFLKPSLEDECSSKPAESMQNGQSASGLSATGSKTRFTFLGPASSLDS